MALTVGIASVFLNLASGYIKVTDATTGASYSKGVLRITAPDGNQYYSPGNSATTFASPNLSTSPDFTVEGGINQAIAIPLNTGGYPQTGIYKIDYNARNGSTTYSYSGVLSTTGFDHRFSNPTDLSVGVTMNTSIPVAVFQDNSDYTVDGIIPTIVRSATLSKNNNTPAFTPQVYTSLSHSLGGTFYAGLYTVALITDLTYSFTNYGVITQVSVTNNSLNVQGYNGPKSISCAQTQLINQMEAAYAAGNTATGNTLRDQLLFLGIYLNQYEWAIRARNNEVRDSAMVKIMSLANVSQACCSDDNYQIISTTLCDCRGFVESPEDSSSTTDSNGDAYELYDMATDGQFFELYVADATWVKGQLQTW